MTLFRVNDVIQYWQKISCSFSSAGLSASDQVFTIQNYWNGFLLDCCRGSNAHGIQSINNSRIKIKIVEGQRFGGISLCLYQACNLLQLRITANYLKFENFACLG